MTAEQLAKQVVGMTEEEAKKTIKGNGFRVRIELRDGVPYGLIMNYKENRINLTINDEKVTKARVG